VRDNGIGITQESIAEIFKMFSQADHAPDRVQDGLGVGLVLVKEFVALHGGNMSASSDGPGHGSVFEIRLPLHPAQPSDFPRLVLRAGPRQKGNAFYWSMIMKTRSTC
jgi:signal transduction histidine kinase